MTYDMCYCSSCHSGYYIYVYYMYILYLCQVGKNQDEMDWK